MAMEASDYVALAGIVLTTVVAVVAMTLAQNSATAASQAVLRQTLMTSGLDFRVKQLNDFYGPLLLRIRQNQRLAERLKAEEVTTWRLLDHIGSILKNPDLAELALQILENDREIASILVEKSGLCEGPIPNEFAHFVSHFQLLELASKGKLRGTHSGEDYYPRKLNALIEAGHAKVKGDVDKILRRTQESLVARS